MLEQWRDEISLSDGPLDWGLFKEAFLERFFPLSVKGEKDGGVNESS